MKINMFKQAGIPLLLALSIFQAGCTGVNRLETSAPYYVSSKADSRGAVVMPPGSVSNGIILNHRLCIEPSPDVIKELLVDTHANVKAKTAVDVDALAKVQTTAVLLAERTQGVVYLRECLYRLCELSNNGSLKPEDVSVNYKLCLDNAKSLTETQIEKPEIEKLRSEERLRHEELETAKSQFEAEGLKAKARIEEAIVAKAKANADKRNTELQDKARKAQQAVEEANAAKREAETKLDAALKAAKDASEKLNQQQMLTINGSTVAIPVPSSAPTSKLPQ